MAFHIRGLDPAPFLPLFALSDAELATRGALRRVADSHPGFPCRVSLDDAEPGEQLVLASFEHQPAPTPYRAGGAIYVRRAAKTPFDAIDRVPPALARRLLSVRAYTAAGMLHAADACDGTAAAPLFDRMLADPAVAYLHVHYAKPGCFACRVDRA